VQNLRRSKTEWLKPKESMPTPQVKRAFTVNEYLAYERAARERHEFIDGQVYEVQSANYSQATITVNLMAEIGNQLRGRDCAALSPNMKVRGGFACGNSTTGFFSYADLMVVCGKRLFHDDQTDVLLNPTVIIEVLSPTTEAYKRGEKFRRYREGVSTFTDYLLVTPTEPVLEHFTLRQDKLWMIAATVTDLSESVPIPSIGCTLKMAEVYDRIDFSDG
jgi:Uma2 family endonuclease